MNPSRHGGSTGTSPTQEPKGLELDFLFDEKLPDPFEFALPRAPRHTEEKFRQLEQSYVRDERWEDLANLLVERASTALPSQAAHCLLRAGQVFETNLWDIDRAFTTLVNALAQYPDDEALAADLARMATVHNRWDELWQKCEARKQAIRPPEKLAEFLVAMALWYEQDLGDLAAAERTLEEAMSADPANQAAVRSLVMIHAQRGDWQRAASYLSCAAGKSIDPMDAVEFAMDAAEIYRDQLHDLEAAEELYLRVLELSPDHPQATAALADSAWAKRDWSTALPLFEGMAGSAKDAMEETARLWQRAGWSAQMAGDLVRARQSYRWAYAAAPNHLPTLTAWSQLAASQGWWQDVVTATSRILAFDRERVPDEDRANHLNRLGQAQMALHDPEAAAQAFREVLALVPQYPGARESLSEAHAQLEGKGPKNAAALIEQYQLLLDGTLSPDERFEILCAIGRLRAEELNDPGAALATFLKAAELRPNDPDVLHEMLEIHTRNQHWSKAVEILERLAKASTGTEKARSLVAMGHILLHELESPNEAVESYRQALEEDPTDQPTFDRVERILAGRQKWRDLARLYRHLIRRLGKTPDAAQRAPLVSLWRKLADTCRLHLLDLESAAAAYEVCASLAPEDRRHLEALAETQEARGRQGFRQAVLAREKLLQTAKNGDAAAAQVQALVRLYSEHMYFDRAYCACAGLCALMRADGQERAYYEQNAPQWVPMAMGILTEKVWQGSISPPREDRRIAQVVAATSPALILARAKPLAEYGIDPRTRILVEQDPSLVCRWLVYVSRWLGIPLPAVYAPPNAAGELDLMIVLEGDHPVPSFVLGRDFTIGRSHQELAFLLTKMMVGLRADHFLLWPQLVPTMAELQVILTAAIRLAQPAFTMPGTDPGMVKQYQTYLQRVLPQPQRAAIASAAEALLADTGQIDLGSWIAGTVESGNRAGLLACGDLVAASREIFKEARANRTRAEESILELVRWGVSTDYLTLREEWGLGLAIDSTRTPPVSRAFADGEDLFP